MSREFSKLLTKILAATMILAIAGWIIFYYVVPQHYLPVLPLMLLFFAMVTLITYSYQLRLAKKDMGKFIRVNMIMSILRLALYSLFAIVYLANNSDKAAVFVGGLITVYIVFTILEISGLARVSRKQ
jgi:hypothetical protein